MAVVAAANRGLEGWKQVKRNGKVDDGSDIGFDNDGLFFGFGFLWDIVEGRSSTAEKSFRWRPGRPTLTKPVTTRLSPLYLQIHADQMDQYIS
jgi:hypothetical protein